MGTKGWAVDDTGGKGFGNKPQSRARGGDSGSNIFGHSTGARAVQKEANVAANATEAQLIENMRTRIAKRGARGIAGISKKFKIADDNRSGSLDKEEFKKAMHDFRIGMSDQQTGLIVNIFDRDSGGKICNAEFLRSNSGGKICNAEFIIFNTYSIYSEHTSGPLAICIEHLITIWLRGYAKINPDYLFRLQ